MTARHLPRISALFAATLLVLAVQSFGMLTSVLAAPAGPGLTLSVDGRPFNLYTPPALEGRSGPLVLVLHGGLSSADEFMSRFSLIAEAERSGFRVAYLDGTLHGRERRDRRTWNAGSCCGSAHEQGIDDVGYLSDIIAGLTAQGLTDPRQVFLLGSSNGAMMSYRFACERGNLIRGVIALSGPLVIDRCGNAAGVRILHIHGTADRLVPIEGGGGGDWLSGSDFRSVEETVAELRAGGATVEVMLIDGANHGVQRIDAAMQSQLGVGLATVVAQFIRNS